MTRPSQELGKESGDAVMVLFEGPEVTNDAGATSVRDSIQIGTRVASRSRTLTFQKAEVAVPHTLFDVISGRIDRLRLVPGAN